MALLLVVDSQQKPLEDEIAEGLVGEDGVVGPLPKGEFLIQGGDLERARGDCIELLHVVRWTRTARPLSFRRAGWQHKQLQTTLLARSLEGGKFTATVHLEGPYRAEHPVREGVQELRREQSGSTAVGFQHIPAGVLAAQAQDLLG